MAIEGRRAWLHTDGWAGRTRQAVYVIGETATRYRIRGDVEVRIAGRRRVLPVGETTLVPKTAITFDNLRFAGIPDTIRSRPKFRFTPLGGAASRRCRECEKTVPVASGTTAP